MKPLRSFGYSGDAERRSTICKDIAVLFICGLALVIAIPLAIVGMLFLLLIDTIGDSRAWKSFSKFWFGRHS